MYKSNYTTKGCIDTIDQLGLDFKLKENSITFFFCLFVYFQCHLTELIIIINSNVFSYFEFSMNSWK